MKTRIFFILLLVILGAASEVLAQEVTIDEREFNAKYRESLKLTKGQSYRVTSVVNKTAEGSQLAFVLTHVNEFVPPDRYRSLSTTMDSTGTAKTESIAIGASRWVRNNDGPWKDISGGGRGSGVGSGGGGASETLKIERSVEYKRIGGTTIGGEPAEFYQQTFTYRFTEEKGSFQTSTIWRNWYNKDGLLLKRESNFVNRDGKISRNTIWSYEYDPKIQIEAPSLPVSKENQ